VQGRLYEKKKQIVAKFISEHAKVDHSVILNEVNIDYDILMKIISELRQEGLLKLDNNNCCGKTK
jgi:predicted transcriptional regulator